MKKHFGFKRTLAGILAVLTVAGYLPLANVGGLLTGGTAIVAHAADNVINGNATWGEDDYDGVFIINGNLTADPGDEYWYDEEYGLEEWYPRRCSIGWGQKSVLIVNGDFIINSGNFEVAHNSLLIVNGNYINAGEHNDGWGVFCFSDCHYIVTGSVNGEDFYQGYVNPHCENIQYDSATDTFTLDGETGYVFDYSTSSFVKSSTSTVIDISNATVNLASDNSVASLSIGNDKVTDLSGFDITYGTDDSHTATSLPTTPGTYYAYVTAKDSNADYSGTAKSAAITLTPQLIWLMGCTAEAQGTGFYATTAAKTQLAVAMQSGNLGTDLRAFTKDGVTSDALKLTAGSYGTTGYAAQLAQIKAAGVVYVTTEAEYQEYLDSLKTDISKATVNLSAYKRVASLTIGNDTITDLSGFDITYGVSQLFALETFPTESGTYYAYVTAKSGTDFKGTATSDPFTVNTSAVTVNWSDIEVGDILRAGTVIHAPEEYECNFYQVFGPAKSIYTTDPVLELSTDFVVRNIAAESNDDGGCSFYCELYAITGDYTFEDADGTYKSNNKGCDCSVAYCEVLRNSETEEALA